MPRTILVVLLLAHLTGCRRNPEEAAVSQPAPPPAAALAKQGQSVDESLRELEKALSAAIGAGIAGEGEKHLLQAEAITDRLLESQLPFMWLTGSAYRLEAYLRQIQALADRVVAEMRSGVDRATVLHDAMELRRKVIGVRRSLAAGGGALPPSLDSLLAAHPADSTIIVDSGE